MDENNKKRFEELAKRAYSRSTYEYTEFLSLSQYSEFSEIKDKLSYAGVDCFGGYDDAERVVLRFGSADYEEEYPICCIKVKPTASGKFAQTLTHRDYLGALMSLQIDRKLIGDISVNGEEAYIFVLGHICDYIIENLQSVKNTRVIAEKCQNIGFSSAKEEVKCYIPSLRVDCFVSEVFRMSRGDSLEYFKKELVFIDGRICTSPSKNLSEGSVVSVRGKGKFVYTGEAVETKKGRLCAVVLKYV